MPQIIETTVYLFSELSDKAKEKARDWIRETQDSNDFSPTTDDFQEYLESIGFKDVETYFTGFNSQGDGASFDFKSVDFDKLLFKQESDKVDYKKIHDDWIDGGMDKGVIKSARRFRNSIYAHSYVINHHYYHSRTRGASIEHDSGNNELFHVANVTLSLESYLTELMESLANHYFRALDNDNDFMNSAEYIDDLIEANEYTFTDTGARFG